MLNGSDCNLILALFEILNNNKQQQKNDIQGMRSYQLNYKGMISILLILQHPITHLI